MGCPATWQVHGFWSLADHLLSPLRKLHVWGFAVLAAVGFLECGLPGYTKAVCPLLLRRLLFISFPPLLCCLLFASVAVLLACPVTSAFWSYPAISEMIVMAPAL